MHRPDLEQLRAHVDQLPTGPLRELVPQALDYVEDLERLLRPRWRRSACRCRRMSWSAPWRTIAAAVEEARRLFPQG